MTYPLPHRMPIEIDGDTAYVTLTQGYRAIIDAADVALVAPLKWHVRIGARDNYAIHKFPKGSSPADIAMHRLLLDAPSGLGVDHIDSNGLNNRRANIRLATKSENGRNQRLSRANTSGYKGVSWHARDRRWRAQIKHFGHVIYLGNFGDPVEAHAAYAEASAKLHGEFGRVA